MTRDKSRLYNIMDFKTLNWLNLQLMQIIKLLKKYVIDSEIYVSLMGTFLAIFFMLEQNVFRFPTVILIFITYFSGYLYTKYQNHQLFRKVLIFNIICGIISLILITLS